MSNCGLLAIKGALDEWRHLLEGAIHSIIIFTDHKNLEYLHRAKSLNPRQARWVLFFSHLQFHITYKPGYKNTMADALSRVFPAERVAMVADTFLQPGHFLLLQSSFIESLKKSPQSMKEYPDSENFLEQDNVMFHNKRPPCTS